MKAQCERCKEIVPFEFALDGDGIRVHCPACDETYQVRPTPTPAPVPVAVPDPDSMTCPKCAHAQKQADACRRCGLVIANWNPSAAPAAPADAAETAALWAACEEGWSDDARHDAFIEACRKLGVLAHAAARYRQAADRPGAADKLARIRTLAEQSLAVAVRTEKKTTSRSKLPLYVLLLAIILIMGVVGARYLLF